MTEDQRRLLDVTRRHFFQQSAFGIGGTALAALLNPSLFAQAQQGSTDEARAMAPKPPHFPAKTKNVIYLFMAGGPSQLDLFDYKPALTKYDGQPVPRNSSKASASRSSRAFPTCSARRTISTSMANRARSCPCFFRTSPISWTTWPL